MKRLKYITAGLALCGILAGLTGCGPANTAEVSGTSGEVSGSAVELPNTDKDVKMASTHQNAGRNRYANSDNMYNVNGFWSDTDEKDYSILIQMKPDGNVVDKIEIEDLLDVLWVNDEWIYYITETDGRKEELCRIPIEKTDRGDKLKVAEKEKLFEVDGEIANDLVVTDTSIFYGCSDGIDEEKLCRYDLDSGESVVLLEDEDVDSLILFNGNDEYLRELWPVVVANNLIVRTQRGGVCDGLYTLDLESSELKNFYSGLSNSWLDNIAQSGDNIFFMPDKKRQQIYRFDGQKTECVLKKGELVEKMSELDLSVEGEISITEIFSYKDRLYFFVTLEMESEPNRPYMINEVTSLLSAPVDNVTQMRHEEKLTDYLRNETNFIYLYDDSQGKIEKRKRTKKGQDILQSSDFLTGPMDTEVILDQRIILQGRNYSSKLCGVAWVSFDYAMYDLETGEITETEAGKAMQQGDKKKLTELYKVP